MCRHDGAVRSRYLLREPLGFASHDGDSVGITVSFKYKNNLYSSHVMYQAFGD